MYKIYIEKKMYKNKKKIQLFSSSFFLFCMIFLFLYRNNILLIDQKGWTLQEFL